jgi:hypothetical protein
MRIPGCTSCHSRSLTEIILDSGLSFVAITSLLCQGIALFAQLRQPNPRRQAGANSKAIIGKDEKGLRYRQSLDGLNRSTSGRVTGEEVWAKTGGTGKRHNTSAKLSRKSIHNRRSGGIGLALSLKNTSI